ncbi:MAG: hypothetical protein ACUVSA_08195 [Desulfosoma sp.]
MSSRTYEAVREWLFEGVLFRSVEGVLEKVPRPRAFVSSITQVWMALERDGVPMPLVVARIVLCGVLAVPRVSPQGRLCLGG